MKITKRQLRRLISESFVVDPEGTVYTPQTKKVPSEYGEVMGDGSVDEKDAPVVYGQDRTKEATPKLYGVITRNWHKIHRFHEKGPEIYEALLKPDTDAATKTQFLFLLNMSDIVTDKEMKQVQLEIDLLTSPDFQVFRDQAAERLDKKHHAEIFADIMKEKDLANNPRYFGYAKKKIDEAIAAGYKYYKDAVELQFFYDMYDLKEKGFKPSYIGYDPAGGGIRPHIFAANNGLRIQDRVENHYSVTDTVHSSTLYHDDLYEYSKEKSAEFIVVIINDLVDAGILEKNEDGRVKMSERSYQIELNNLRGRKEDFYKQSGTRSAFLDDPYEPNPNLPVLTKEGKMKITRKELRRLISEMARTPMEDPRKDLAKYLDPEQMKKIQNLYDTGDEETLAQIDAVSDAFGGSPHFSGLMSRYGVEPIMNEFEFAEAYLSTDQLKQLMQAKGKELVMVFDEWYDVVGFQDSSTRDSIIDPVELHKMVVLVEAKQPQFGGKVLIDDLEHPDKSANYYQTLFKFLEAIIKVSKITYTSEHYAAALGMGEYGHTTDGSYSLHSPFSELQESGKLFLGYPAKRNI